jgi:hypothetical protein
VYHPCGGGRELTGKDEFHCQVKSLGERLEMILPKLNVLFDQRSCTREKGRSAWDWVFNHEFWAAKETVTQKSGIVPLPNSVVIKCALAACEGGPPIGEYASDSRLLPKGLHLCFSVAWTDVDEPYEVHWICQNEGDEAARDKQLGWEATGPIKWTSTKYKGNQRMICQIERHGRIIARAVHLVRIGKGRFTIGGQRGAAR